MEAGLARNHHPLVHRRESDLYYMPLLLTTVFPPKHPFMGTAHVHLRVGLERMVPSKSCMVEHL